MVHRIRLTLRSSPNIPQLDAAEARPALRRPLRPIATPRPRWPGLRALGTRAAVVRSRPFCSDAFITDTELATPAFAVTLP